MACCDTPYSSVSKDGIELLGLLVFVEQVATKLNIDFDIANS